MRGVATATGLFALTGSRAACFLSFGQDRKVKAMTLQEVPGFAEAVERHKNDPTIYATWVDWLAPENTCIETRLPPADVRKHSDQMEQIGVYVLGMQHSQQEIRIAYSVPPTAALV